MSAKDEKDSKNPRSPQGSKDTTDVKSKSARSGSKSLTKSRTSKSATKSQTTQPDDGDEEKSVKILVAKICKSDASAERVELSKELAHHLATGMCALFIFGLFLVIAIVEIVVGSLNVDNCPVNHMIPIWLIVSGGVSCLRYVLAIGLGIVDRKKKNLGTLRAWLEFIFTLFWLVWFILGTYWTYSVSGIVKYEKNYVHGNKSAYCDHVTYVLAFVLITVTYVIIAVWLICCCCVVCCAVCILAGVPPPSGRSRRESKRSDEKRSHHDSKKSGEKTDEKTDEKKSRHDSKKSTEKADEKTDEKADE